MTDVRTKMGQRNILAMTYSSVFRLAQLAVLQFRDAVHLEIDVSCGDETGIVPAQRPHLRRVDVCVVDAWPKE